MKPNLNLSKPWYEIMPELFERCHEEKIFEDEKLIADSKPNAHMDDVKNNYHSLKSAKYFDFKEFFNTFFTIPESNDALYSSNNQLPLEEHIQSLWPILTRKPDKIEPNSSLIPLPFNYVVPGGRFTEIYYWDSYFTMLGLKVNHEDLAITSMIDNFEHMIQTIGYIPNGNRLYYLGRSQPPFFSNMITLLAEIKGEEIYTRYNNALEIEYNYWMDPEHHKTVHFKEDQCLNRYYDQHTTPRIEMYHEDVKLSEDIENKNSFFSNIRSACESGWDFSSRWFLNSTDIKTIITTAIIPVDLNCLLYHMESTLAKAFKHDANKSQYYSEAAAKRKNLINSMLWNEETQSYADYNFVTSEISNDITAAALFPLFVNIASSQQASKVAQTVSDKLLKPGGIVTTEYQTGQQWDAPNGWAPLQWIAYKGLKNYGHIDLADKIKNRWLTLNEKVFQSTGKMMEKYNVEDLCLEAGGGEYPVQDGFGWSNGVYLAMKYDDK